MLPNIPGGVRQYDKFPQISKLKSSPRKCSQKQYYDTACVRLISGRVVSADLFFCHI